MLSFGWQKLTGGTGERTGFRNLLHALLEVIHHIDQQGFRLRTNLGILLIEVLELLAGLDDLFGLVFNQRNLLCTSDLTLFSFHRDLIKGFALEFCKPFCQLFDGVSDPPGRPLCYTVPAAC